MASRGQTGQVHVASGAGASNREERAPWEPWEPWERSSTGAADCIRAPRRPRRMMPSTSMAPRREAQGAQTSAGPRGHAAGRRRAGDRSKRGDDWSLIHRYSALLQRHASDTSSSTVRDAAASHSDGRSGASALGVIRTQHPALHGRPTSRPHARVRASK
jgi:hypothetical protein